jgi:hypothetical protein
MKFVIRVNSKPTDVGMLVSTAANSALPTQIKLEKVHLAYRYAKLD